CIFFTVTATTPFSTLSLHDALPISKDPLSTEADTAEHMPGDVDTVTFLQSATGGVLQITVTSLLKWVLPRMSTKLACSTLVPPRSEEHTSELQSRSDLVCRLLLEKK